MKIVLDLDGTILAFNEFRHDDIFGAPIDGAANFLSLANLFDHELLLWSSRPRAKAIKYLSTLSLGSTIDRDQEVFLNFFGIGRYRGDWVNRIPDDWQPGNAPRVKPYYDWQLDDRTIGADIPRLGKWKPRTWTPLSWARACVLLWENSNIAWVYHHYDPKKVIRSIREEYEGLAAHLKMYMRAGMSYKYAPRSINRKTTFDSTIRDEVKDSNSFLTRWEARGTLVEIQLIIWRCDKELKGRK